MRRNSKIDSGKSKKIARAKYKERQIDKWIKWSVDVKGYVKYKHLVDLQERYNIKVYG